MSIKKSVYPFCFNFREPKRGHNTWKGLKHYHQVIWPDATRVGVGIAHNEDMDTYLVAQYMSGLPQDGKIVPCKYLKEKRHEIKFVIKFK